MKLLLTSFISLFLFCCSATNSTQNSTYTSSTPEETKNKQSLRLSDVQKLLKKNGIKGELVYMDILFRESISGEFSQQITGTLFLWNGMYLEKYLSTGSSISRNCSYQNKSKVTAILTSISRIVESEQTLSKELASVMKSDCKIQPIFQDGVRNFVYVQWKNKYKYLKDVNSPYIFKVYAHCSKNFSDIYDVTEKLNEICPMSRMTL